MPSLSVCVQIIMLGFVTSKSFGEFPLIKSHSSALDYFCVVSSFSMNGTLDKRLSLLATRQVARSAHLYGSVCCLSRLVWRTHDSFLLGGQTSRVSGDNRYHFIIGVTRYMIRKNTSQWQAIVWEMHPTTNVCQINQSLEQYDHMHLGPLTMSIYFRRRQIRHSWERCSRKPAREVCPRFSYCKDLSLDWSHMYGFLQSIWWFRNPLWWQETECPNLTAAHRRTDRRQ
jgi:hypothetical protein